MADKNKKRDIDATMDRLAELIAKQVDHLEQSAGSGALSPEGISTLLSLVSAAGGVSRTKVTEAKHTPKTLPKSKKSPDEILKTIKALSDGDD